MKRGRMIDTDRLYSIFMELCAVDSEPLGERLMADRMTVQLQALGFTVTEDDTGGKIGGNAGNLYARLAGTAPGEPLLFSCHLDRVVPGVGVKPRIEGDAIVSDGSTVLGADDAAGLAALLEAVTALQESGSLYPAIEVVLTVAEELALVGSSHFDLSPVVSRIGFVLDAGGPVGGIVVRAPQQYKFTAQFHGRSAHAGIAPEQGISAIQMAALAISRMELLRIDEETTANIGSISAVGPTNIVPERCELRGEVRSLDPAKVQFQLARLTEVIETAANESGGTVTVTTTPCYPALRLNETCEPAQRAARAAERIGVPVRFSGSGGGSDANYFNERGVPTVVLCCGYEKVHTTAERMPLDQLALLAGWVTEIIAGGVAEA